MERFMEIRVGSLDLRDRGRRDQEWPLHCSGVSAAESALSALVIWTLVMLGSEFVVIGSGLRMLRS